ncbi:MAG: TraR/DksA family transcriptional regulator [Alphaproteobacteria bacterium]|nr:MAG: TraR/DksA family transcriptional regulator [Alphaproteobacteria bacterium]
MPQSNTEIRQALNDRRAELLQSSADHEADRAPVELDQQSVGRLSRMDAIQVQAMAKDAERRRQDEVRRIDAALARLDAGEYGYCVTCGEDIAPKRLAFDRSIPTCIDCARGGKSA